MRRWLFFFILLAGIWLPGGETAVRAETVDKTGAVASIGDPVLPVHILPEPVSVAQRAGVFRFTATTKIVLLTEDKEAVRVINDFAGWWTGAMGAQLVVEVRGEPGAKTGGAGTESEPGVGARRTPTGSERVPGKNGLAARAPDSLDNRLVISLGPVPGVNSEEGYVLEIGRRQVQISAPGPAGLFYALESLRQLLPAAAGPGRVRGAYPVLPCALILDYPRYAYRGMHLDVSRHFFDVAFIKKYLEILASYKINTFHWHLTDSHGWRLEIKQYPRLTSVGAWRADRTGIPMTIAEATGKDEPATYGGYYTQEQVRDIIRFAQERFITIVPEIEMPGHCTAALVAYPQFSDLNNPVPLLVPCGYPGDLLHNLCVGYDSTFVFLQNILQEVMDLFPSRMIHIGGDEVRGGPWLSCSRCQERMKENGLSTSRELQAWFTQRIDSFISSRGRVMIGWDEILEAKLRPGGAVMSWHGDIGVRAGAAKGLGVVMAPYHYTYFDFYQSDPQLEPDITYAALSLDTVYAFDPTPPGLTAGERQLILGGEACLWTENIATPARVEYMLLPRLFALSEDLWSLPEKKDYARFVAKTEEQFGRLDAAGIHYATSLYNVGIRPVYDSLGKSISVLLSDQAGKYQIRYTTDGSRPSATSPLYGGEIRLVKTTTKLATKSTTNPVTKSTTNPAMKLTTNPVTKSTTNPALNERTIVTAKMVAKTQMIVTSKTIDLKTALFRDGKRMGKINEDSFALHKGVDARLVSSRTIPKGETGMPDRDRALLDGIFGTVEPYDGRWVSFTDSLVSLTIDLGQRQAVRSVSLHCMEDQVGNIFLPRELIIEGSEDGERYAVISDVVNQRLPAEALRHVVTYRGERTGRTAIRYIRVRLRNANLFAEAEKNMLLLDEIVIR